MKFPKEEYLSVIGSNWLHPIAKLLEELNKCKLGKGNAVQVSVIENGYSVAIIVSTVLMVESYLNRMISIINYEKGKKCTIKTRDSFREYFGPSKTADKLDELFVIRDAISHNHIWEANISWNINGKLEFIEPPKLEDNKFYGNRKYRTVINEEERTTKLLRLNLFPTKIGREDAINVIINSFEVLSSIEKKDRRYCYISHIPVKYNKEVMVFSDFISKLSNPNFKGDNHSDDDIAERVP